MTQNNQFVCYDCGASAAECQTPKCVPTDMVCSDDVIGMGMKDLATGMFDVPVLPLVAGHSVYCSDGCNDPSFQAGPDVVVQPACPTPRPAPPGPAVWIEDLSALPGQTTTLSVLLATGSAVVAGAQADIGFDPSAPIVARPDSAPDCTVNPNINKAATEIRFQPPGCAGVACTSVRAFVFSTDNRNAIPDGAVLFTCTITIAADAAAALQENVSGVGLSDPASASIPGATGRAGDICVIGGQR